MLGQYGMFCFSIGYVWIVWYVLFFYWICLDSVVCFVFLLDMFGQCGMFCFSIGYVWTAWYVLFFYWICLDNMVCFVFLLDMFGQYGMFCFSIGYVWTVWYVLFFVLLEHVVLYLDSINADVSRSETYMGQRTYSFETIGGLQNFVRFPQLQFMLHCCYK